MENKIDDKEINLCGNCAHWREDVFFESVGNCFPNFDRRGKFEYNPNCKYRNTNKNN